MSDPPTPRQDVRPQGVIGGLLTLPLRLFGMLCGSLLMAILIECVSMHFLWPEESWHHADGMLEDELTHLSSYFTQSLLLNAPTQTARAWVSTVHDAVLVKSGVFDGAEDSLGKAVGEAPRDKSFRHYLTLIYLHVESYVRAAGYVCLTFIVRLLVLCLTLPLFLMAAFVGLMDGLARRDIRRFGAGRESGFLYHRARSSITPIAVLPWVLYLAMPVSVHPLMILLPGAILLSLAVDIAVGSFKKYL